MAQKFRSQSESRSRYRKPQLEGPAELSEVQALVPIVTGEAIRLWIDDPTTAQQKYGYDESTLTNAVSFLEGLVCLWKNNPKANWIASVENDKNVRAVARKILLLAPKQIWLDRKGEKWQFMVVIPVADGSDPTPSDLSTPESMRSGENQTRYLRSKRPAPTGAISLDGFLGKNRRQRYWPKRKDIRNEMLFSPNDLMNQIQAMLTTNRGCLIRGQSGSGKTGLAIAFALRWSDEYGEGQREENRNVWYLDAEQAHAWKVVQVTDFPSSDLILIDNGQLDAEAVNDFIESWSGRGEDRPYLIVISTPQRDQDHFQNPFDDQHAVIKLAAEQIWEGVVLQYSRHLCTSQPSKYGPVENTLASVEERQRLHKLCGHNLVQTRAVLEAWENLGGSLLDVDRDQAMESLADRYLHPSSENEKDETTREEFSRTIARLCVLQRFEICIPYGVLSHFVGPRMKDVDQTGWLIRNPVGKYGACRQLDLHPETARLVGRAYVAQMRGIGAQLDENWHDFVVTTLREYMLLRPQNVVEVFRRLQQEKRAYIVKQLLFDSNVWTAAIDVLKERPFEEQVNFLMIASRTNPEHCDESRIRLIGDVSAEELGGKIAGVPPKHFALVLCNLCKLMETETIMALPNVSSDAVKGARNWSVNSLLNLLNSEKFWQLAKCNDAIENWRKAALAALDLEERISTLSTRNWQQLFWFLRGVKKLIPERTERVASRLNHRQLAVGIIAIRWTKWPLAIQKLKQVLPHEDFQVLLREMDDVARTEGRHLNDSMGKELDLRRIDIEQYADVKSVIWRGAPEVSKILSARIADGQLLNGMPLQKLGTYLERHFHQVRTAYVLFQRTALADRLQRESLRDITYFLRRIRRVRNDGPQLATDALTQVSNESICHRLSDADALAVSTLIRLIHATACRRLVEVASDERFVNALLRCARDGNVAQLAELSSALSECLSDSLKAMMGSPGSHFAADEVVDRLQASLSQSLCENLGAVELLAACPEYCDAVGRLKVEFTGPGNDDATVRELRAKLQREPPRTRALIVCGLNRISSECCSRWITQAIGDKQKAARLLNELAAARDSALTQREQAYIAKACGIIGEIASLLSEN